MHLWISQWCCYSGMSFPSLFFDFLEINIFTFLFRKEFFASRAWVVFFGPGACAVSIAGLFVVVTGMTVGVEISVLISTGSGKRRASAQAQYASYHASDNTKPDKYDGYNDDEEKN